MASIFTGLIDRQALARLAQPIIHRLLLRLAKRLSDRGIGQEADWVSVFTALELIIAAEIIELLTDDPPPPAQDDYTQ